MIKRLKTVIDETTTPAGRLFDLFFQALIVCSLILFSLETVPELDKYKDFFRLAEIMILSLFTLEYALRVFDALWWAVATLTTVGYGDIYPITAGGRVFTFVILMIGLGIVSVPSALLASALTKND